MWSTNHKQDDSLLDVCSTTQNNHSKKGNKLSREDLEKRS